MSNSLHPRTLILLLSSIALMVLPHFLHVRLPIMAFFFLLLTWRFIAIWKPQYLPSQLTVFCLLISGISLLVYMHSGIFGRDAGTMVFITALGLKLLEIKSQRDLYLISYLAFIVAASQFLYLQNIAMAAYILFVSISLLATLLSINGTSLKNTQAIKKSAIILMQAIPLMIVLFIFFPRIETPRWSFLDENNQARTGLSDSLEPGSISKLSLSGEVVFRAKFKGKIPPKQERYWRGPVFSYTDGKRWSASKNIYYQRFQDAVTYTGKAYDYSLLMEPQAKNWVFALDMPAKYSSALRQNVVYQLTTHKAFNKPAEYNISSYANYNTGYITKTEYKDNLQLHAQPAKRIKQLVKKLGGFQQPAEQYIDNVLQHFNKENFHYTLMPPILKDKPVERFLFESKAGFCGHYASAFVTLMRVAEIPARIVTGYQGGSYNPNGKFIEVRSANAHAWAEVWLQGRGWVRFDPTSAIAPERINYGVNIEQQIAQQAISFAPMQLDSHSMSFLKSMRQLWSSADYSWQRWIINYSRSNQMDLLAGFGINTLKKLFYYFLGMVMFISLITAFIVLRTRKNKLSAEQILYQQACDKLAHLQLTKAPHEGANDFLQRVKQAAPQSAAAFAEITQRYIQIRYQKNHDTAPVIQQLKQAVKQFKTP